MAFRVLGPVVALRDGRTVRLPPRLCTLLAALLLESNRVVPCAELIDRIWDSDPPRSAQATLQTYVMRLRRALGDTDKGSRLIHTDAHGYRIEVPAADLDLARFREHLALASEAERDGQRERQRDQLCRALELWQGPPLADLPPGSLHRDVVPLLAEDRFHALEQRIELDLRLGRHADVVAELRALVAAHPLRERPHVQLMLALHHCGRQAEALSVYLTLHRSFRDELGLEPGEEARTLQRAILAGTVTGLPSAAPASASGPGSCGPPRQLPPAPPDFVGRRSQCAQVVIALRDRSVRLCALNGKPGAGKTALALHIGAELVTAYPDGQLYARLGGTAPQPARAPEILARFIRALGGPAELPQSADELAGLYRSLLADRAILVVLDDALDEAQVRPLLPGGGRSGVLITGRTRLVGLEGATLLGIDVLGIDEAVELLGRVAGSERVAAELGAARDIARLCGGLPLAVRTAGARLAGRVSWPIAYLADRLRDERQRLDELAAGDLEVRASLALSCRTLRADERAAFRRLGLIGVSEFGGWLLGPLMDVPPPEAARLAERLTDAQLVDPAGFDGTGQSRYRLHDLLRVYGAELAETEESRADRCATLARTVRSWLWLVNRAAQLSAAGTLRLDSDAADEPDLDPAIVRALQRNPRAWFETEHATLAEVVARATDLDQRAVASGLATALLTWPLAARRQFERWSGAHEAALLEFRRTDDGPGEARLLAGLGKLRYEQDRFAEARGYLDAAESAFGVLADRHGVATVQSILGKLAVEQGRYAEAAHHLDAAREFFVETGHQVGIANVERTLGRIHREQGRFELAMTSFRAALAVYQQVGSARGEAITRNGIAMVHRGTGSLCRAAEELVLAAELLERVGDRLTLSYTHQDLAKVRIRQGRLGSVRADLDRSLELCRSLDDRFGQALALRTLGALEIALGDGPAAVRQLAQALTIWRAIDLPLFAARARRDLALAHQLMGNRYAAACCWAAALETFRAFGARESTEMTTEAARRTLGLVVAGRAPATAERRPAVVDGLLG